MSNKEIRILSVIPGPEEGYSMIFSKRQVKTLNGLGLNVKPFFLSSRTSLKVILSEIKRIRKEIKEFNPDIIHSNYGTITALFCIFTSTKKLVVTFQGSDLNRATDMSWFRSFLGRCFSQLAVIRSCKVICVSKKLKNKIWWFKSKAVVISVGVNINFFKLVERNDARKKIGWELDEKIVLFNASNPIIKRLDIAQEVERILKKRDQKIRFAYLTGKIPDNEILYYPNAADALLMCSDTEGSPVVIKEAMACNLPIVSNDIGDVVERISNVIPSSIVKRDINIISDALWDILKSGKRSNGREQIVLQGLTEEQIADQIKNVYIEILK